MSTGRIAALTPAGSGAPSSPRTVLIIRPPTQAAPPVSEVRMCAFSSTMISSPRLVCESSATRLPIVPLGMNMAASFPRSLAANRSNSSCFGSSPYTESPRIALNASSRMVLSGSVMVSLLRSIFFIKTSSRHTDPKIVPQITVFEDTKLHS